MSPDDPLFAGTLILVVGPSGAGKDTLIRAAADAFPATVLRTARRTVTRAASDAEDHDVLEPSAFEAAQMEGRFAVVWNAHGLAYAVPRSIDRLLDAGICVMCNVSREAVGTLRATYPRTVVIYVEAPLAVRRQRVERRQRLGETPERADRVVAFASEHADLVIDNGGTVAAGCEGFVAAVGRILAAQGSSRTPAKVTLPGTSVE